MKNLNKVMKRAWEIARKLEGDLAAKLSFALKKAWEEVKKAADPVATVKAICGADSRVTLWQKYGKKRIYVKLYFKNCTQDFYIDLQTGRSYGQSASIRHACTEALGF